MSENSRPNSKSQVIVLTILHEGLTPTRAAERFGLTPRQIHYLLSRYRQGGLQALEPKSRRPNSNSRALTAQVRGAIITLRRQLTDGGSDAGAASIAWHLKESGYPPPALSTFWRILKAGGLVVPQPKKRPKASFHRFEAVQPNETWQSDFTHWRLKDGSDVEIINWLDDHSRLLLKCTVHRAISGGIVMESFNQCRSEYGTPFSTLTDNGNVYTARFARGKNGFEYLLSELGVVQKNGSPGHPQTQGKTERFHHTLKKWLALQKPAEDLNELQHQLNEFRRIYNTLRPHKSLEMRTPASSYAATIKATPKDAKAKEHYRLRRDHVDPNGKISLRRAGKMHHLGVGIDHHHKQVIILVDHYWATVVEKKTGEIISQHEIAPTKIYWTNILVDEETKRTRKPK